MCRLENQETREVSRMHLLNVFRPASSLRVGGAASGLPILVDAIKQGFHSQGLSGKRKHKLNDK